MKSDIAIKRDLGRIREWAQGKIKAGSEPPWSWYQYMKLIEAADAILEGMTIVTTVNSRQSEPQRGKRPRLVGATYRQDTAPPRPIGTKVRLPM